MKDFEKKQGVGVAKEPRRNIEILGLRLHYRFGNHVLQIPSNYFHSSAFHKRFSHGYLTRISHKETFVREFTPCLGNYAPESSVKLFPLT